MRRSPVRLESACARSPRLARLRELGILNWVRRCAESWRDGRVVLEQQTNAYAVLPEGQWRGWRPPLEAPGPAPGTWGEPTPMPDAVTLARLEADMMGKVMALAVDREVLKGEYRVSSIRSPAFFPEGW